MRIENEIKLDFSDVLLRPKRSELLSRKDVKLEREFRFYHSKKRWKGVPIISANMKTCGTFEMARVLSKYGMITAFHKYYSIEEYEEFFREFDNPDYVCYTLGIRNEDKEKLKRMVESGLIDKFSFVCLDIPNGYIVSFLEHIKELRQVCPEHIIVAGNVVTNEMAEEIILAGADVVKVGIGSGSACTTRRQTGVGYPQLSATIECADASHGISNEQGFGLIVSDGGQVYPSCVAKSFCAGGDFVMCGSLFSGFEQSAGELVEVNDKKYKEYYGSSSNKAINENYGKKDSHRASEGRHTLIPYKGDVNDFIQDLLGSLRSTGTYIGARRLKEFSKRASFIRVNNQLNESLSGYDTEKR